MRNFQTGRFNYHEICELGGSATKDYKPERIGVGVFSFINLFNHSCYENVHRACHGSTIVLSALRSIKKGEQLFINYG